MKRPFASIMALEAHGCLIRSIDDQLHVIMTRRHAIADDMLVNYMRVLISDAVNCQCVTRVFDTIMEEADLYRVWLRDIGESEKVDYILRTITHDDASSLMTLLGYRQPLAPAEVSRYAHYALARACSNAWNVVTRAGAEHIDLANDAYAHLISLRRAPMLAFRSFIRECVHARNNRLLAEHDIDRLVSRAREHLREDDDSFRWKMLDALTLCLDPPEPSTPPMSRYAATSRNSTRSSLTCTSPTPLDEEERSK